MPSEGSLPVSATKNSNMCGEFSLSLGDSKFLLHHRHAVQTDDHSLLKLPKGIS